MRLWWFEHEIRKPIQTLVDLWEGEWKGKKLVAIKRERETKKNWYKTLWDRDDWIWSWIEMIEELESM